MKDLLGFFRAVHVDGDRLLNISVSNIFAFECLDPKGEKKQWRIYQSPNAYFDILISANDLNTAMTTAQWELMPD